MTRKYSNKVEARRRREKAMFLTKEEQAILAAAEAKKRRTKRKRSGHKTARISCNDAPDVRHLLEDLTVLVGDKLGRKVSMTQVVEDALTQYAAQQGLTVV